MKRFYIWLRELTLSQQLLTLIMFVVTIFSMFILIVLIPQINSFTDNEMERVLHGSHDQAAYYMARYPESSYGSVPVDGDVLMEIYDENTGLFRPLNRQAISDQDEEIIKEKILSGAAGDFTITYRDRVGMRINSVYTFTEITEGRWLVSYLPGQYEETFRAGLTVNSVNTTVGVVTFLFVMLMLWVASIIHPINQMKLFINKIKNDEFAYLEIDRHDEIGDLADALMDMNFELQRQNHMKQEMLQNISHDLKTPVATIKSYGESIKDGIYPYGSLEKSVDVIIEHADRLENKVRSLITLNKMGYLLDDCPEGDNLNMNEVIDKVLLSLKVIRPEITFVRVQDEHVMFHGEEDPWRIVVENLVDNALRYARSTIRIELHPYELIIHNDGDPIEEDRLDVLFEPYEKGTDGQFGLGLSIVYRVVTTYGYRVEAENVQDGVQFRIWRVPTKKEQKAKKQKKHD
ncbi:MAG: HAMP domain-containing histidine kinase [Solobacterium sp.]|nr:HAMP domain-containing histidine kinase [Solobacterium sp.]